MVAHPEVWYSPVISMNADGDSFNALEAYTEESLRQEPGCHGRDIVTLPKETGSNREYKLRPKTVLVLVTARFPRVCRGPQGVACM